MLPRDLILLVSNKGNVPRCYIEIIKGMYEGAETSVRTIYGETIEFPLTIGLH